MYQSLRRAAFTAIALSAAAWALVIAVGRELVEVPLARAAPTPVLAQTVEMATRPPSRSMRPPTAAHRVASIRVTSSISLPAARRVRQ